MPQTTVLGDVVRQACIEFPSATTRGLATKLWNEHRPLFTNYEHCRATVRRYRGESGDEHRKKIRNGPIPTTKAFRELPESLHEDITPFQFTQAGAGAILSDLHVPYHDKDAIETAIEYCIQRKHTDFVILNGDVCDCHSLSRFQTDPRKKDFAKEVDKVIEVLDSLDDVFGKIYWKLGNHELRWKHYVWNKAPEIMGLAALEWGNLFKLQEFDAALIKENESIHVGPLTIVHGHEFGRSVFNPVNAARGLFLRGKASSICGHHHSTSEHTEQTMRGEVIATWGAGCLCKLTPEFYPMAVTKWNHGFALLDFDGVREYVIENKRIVASKVR